MDIAQPLSTLRRLLEAQLNISLNDYEFWLQDSIKVRLLFCASCLKSDSFYNVLFFVGFVCMISGSHGRIQDVVGELMSTSYRMWVVEMKWLLVIMSQ